MTKYKLYLRLFLKPTCLAPIITLLVPVLAMAQVTTTYSYDANGRLTAVERGGAFFETFEFDDAGNLIEATGTATQVNNPPVCTDPSVTTSSSSGTWSGLLGCSDPDGDVLTLSSVTDPPGTATATKSGNQIQMQNLNTGNTVTTRTISDGNGGVVNSNFTVGYLPPPPPF